MRKRNGQGSVWHASAKGDTAVGGGGSVLLISTVVRVTGAGVSAARHFVGSRPPASQRRPEASELGASGRTRSRTA